MEFIHDFVAGFGRKCVDLVHAYSKKAYVFYDGHWVGVEPYGPRFKDFKVAILTAWGRLRSWIASGHFHPGLEYNELIESLAGLPVEVEFISFDVIATSGIPRDVKVIINCGRAGSAWSGGHFWNNPDIVTALTGWVAKGGGFIGIVEPSALAREPGEYFQLSSILGVDRDRGERLALARRKYTKPDAHFITAALAGEPGFGSDIAGIYTTAPSTEVLASRVGRGPEFIEGSVTIATNTFVRGRSVYLSGFKCTHENTRLLHRAIAWAAYQETGYAIWSGSSMSAECAYFPKKGKLVVINNAGGAQQTEITLADGRTTRNVALAPTASPSSTPDRRGDRFRHGPTARREAQGTRETEETGIAQKVTKTTKLPDSVFRSRVLSFVWQMSLRSVLRYLCDIEETRAAGPGRPGRDSGIS